MDAGISTTWKVHPTYTNYIISSQGDVYSLLSKKVLRPLNNGKGYMQVSLRRNKKSHKKYVHRLVLEAFVGISSLDVNHKDTIKTNNCLKNLEYCTRQQNIHHAVKHGLRFQPCNKGEKHGRSKLNENNINEIRNSAKNTTKLMKKFNVSRSTINRIKNRKIWRHM